MQRIIEAILQKHLVPAGDYIYGFSDLQGLPGTEFSNYPYGICIGRKLDKRIVDSIADGPTVEYYAHYRQMNSDLAAASEAICRDLEQEGVRTRPVEPSVATGLLDTAYHQDLRTPVSHKMIGTRAGLGWIGKTDLFVSLRFGPRLRLVTILTDTPLVAKSKPIDRSRCGTCSLCVEICPAHAANGLPWDITVDRDEFFDAFKCREQCAEFGRSKLGLEARVCGMCVNICPIGR